MNLKQAIPKQTKRLTIPFTNAEIKEIQNYIKAAKTLEVNTPSAAAPTVEDVIYTVVMNFIDGEEFKAGIKEPKTIVSKKAAEKAAAKAAKRS